MMVVIKCTFFDVLLYLLTSCSRMLFLIIKNHYVCLVPANHVASAKPAADVKLRKLQSVAQLSSSTSKLALAKQNLSQSISGRKRKQCTIDASFKQSKVLNDAVSGTDMSSRSKTLEQAPFPVLDSSQPSLVQSLNNDIGHF